VLIRILPGLFILILLAGCSQQVDEPTFHAVNNPDKLSDWGLLKIQSQKLHTHTSTTAYTLKTALFTDYAHKLRTIWIPPGNENGTLSFPTGTIISKTFYYPLDSNNKLKLHEQANEVSETIDLTRHKLIETRLLVKRADGWVGLPYIWNAEQTDAQLQRFGEAIEVQGVDKDNQVHEFNYLVPDVNQCAACHQWDSSKELLPIGLKPRHLKIDEKLVTVFSELAKMEKSDSEIVDSKTLDAQAREYLDINCSHCHNPEGPANTSGLHLESFRPLDNHFGLCKLPIAAGSGTGDRRYDINPGKPNESIFTYRLASNDPASMMPELGRALVHDEGLQLINEWISSLEANCE
jgi:uncharacterized repeat protein (TIGR03806 family)